MSIEVAASSWIAQSGEFGRELGGSCFGLVSRRFGLVTCRFGLVSRGFGLDESRLAVSCILKALEFGGPPNPVGSVHDQLALLDRRSSITDRRTPRLERKHLDQAALAAFPHPQSAVPGVTPGTWSPVAWIIIPLEKCRSIPSP